MHILLIFLIIFLSPVLVVRVEASEPSPFKIDLLPYSLEAENNPIIPGQKIGKLVFQDAVELKSNNSRFGGFSSLNIIGNQLYALSDGGRLLRTQLVLKNNKIDSLVGGSLVSIWPDGSPTPPKENYDSEAMAHIKDDQFAIGFEQQHRIAFYHFGKTISLEKTFPAPESLFHLTKPNKGIEAVIPLSPDHLFVLTEAAKDPVGNTIGYILDTKKATWETLSYKPTGDFRTTDLAVLNKDYFLLLERSYSLFKGLQARISLIDRRTIHPGALLETIELAQLDNHSNIDNMEGIQALSRSNGDTDIFLISDDNFNPLQHTILVWLKYRPHS